jgi:hypothetical protein
LITGASSADSRSSVIAASPSPSFERVETLDEGLDVLLRGDRHLAGEARDHLDVVNRDHVRGVGHRQ